MRLRLGLLNEDLADRFDISPTVCSNTFKTWVRIIRLVLAADGLIKWLPKETILEHMPKNEMLMLIKDYVNIRH